MNNERKRSGFEDLLIGLAIVFGIVMGGLALTHILAGFLR